MALTTSTMALTTSTLTLKATFNADEIEYRCTVRGYPQYCLGQDARIIMIIVARLP